MGLGSRGRCRGEALQGPPHAPVLGMAGVEDTLWLLWGGRDSPAPFHRAPCSGSVW